MTKNKKAKRWFSVGWLIFWCCWGFFPGFIYLIVKYGDKQYNKD